MMSTRSKPRLLSCLLLAVALVASASTLSSAVASSRSFELTVATELAMGPSGKQTVRQLVQDPATGRWIPLEDSPFTDAEIQFLPPPNAADEPGATAQQPIFPILQALGVLLSDMWPDNDTINFRKAADIRNPQRNFFRNTANRFVNRNRGDNRVPPVGTTNQRNVRFLPPSNFQGGAAEAQNQYNFDEINEIGLDEDNILFFTLISNPHNPEDDPIIRAIRFSSGQCSTVAGRFFCPLFLVEGDIFFRVRQTITQQGQEVTLRGFFEDLNRNQRRRLIIAMIKFIHGHFSDAWAHSLQGGNSREVNAQSINRNNSRTWRETRDGDDFLYSNFDPEENGPMQGPALRPRRNSVIDVNDLEPPTLRQGQTARQALFDHRQFVETNLRGYNNRRNLVATLFEGRNQNNANRILQISGSAVNRALTLSDGSPGEAAYRVSHLFITDPEDWERLRDRVMNNGRRDARANGVRWDRILVVNVCVTGHTRDGGGAERTVCQPYRYAYDIPPGEQ